MLIGLAIAAPVPWWLFAATIAVFLIGLNYSYGLRLSYWLGGGELVTFLAVAATLLLPYALVTDSVPTIVAVESALVGLWMLQIAIFSNTQDAAGDREAGRHTIAASVSPGRNEAFIAAVFVLSWGLLLVSLASGLLAPVYLLLLLVAPLHLWQLVAGLGQGRWLLARTVGFWAFRASTAVLFVANLVAVSR
jgi:1,4-dihydroxy-2-naphthoate octaprenyltransferase